MFKRICRGCYKYTFYSVAAAIIFFAVLLNIGRFIAPVLDHQRAFFETWASRAFQQRVHIKQVTGWWHGFEPEVQFSDVTVISRHTQHAVLRIKKVSIGIDVWHSLLHWQLLPGRLSISGANLDIFQDAQGHVMMRGIAGRSQNIKQYRSTKFRYFITWLLMQTHLSMNHVHVVLHGKHGAIWPIKDLRLSANNHESQHYVSGNFSLLQSVPTKVKFIVNLQSLGLDDNGFNANVYIHAKQVELTRWLKQPLIARYLSGVNVRSGNSDMTFWADWRQGKLQRAQLLFLAKRLHLLVNKNLKHLPLLKKNQSLLLHKDLNISGVDTNITWRRNSNGWQVLVDHLRMFVNGNLWPDNSIGFRYMRAHDKKPSKLIAYVDYLSLADLYHLAHAIGYWPKPIADAYQRLKPHGNVERLTIELTKKNHWNPKVRIALKAGFSDLSFNSYGKIPAVSGLSGNLTLMPKQGSLLLDSRQSEFRFPNVFDHGLHFKKLTADVRWQKTSSGIEVKATAIDADDGNLHVNAQASLQMLAHKPPVLSLLGGFSLRDVSQSPYYVPTKIVSKALGSWLQTAFKQGSISDGAIVYQGNLQKAAFSKRLAHMQIFARLKAIAFQYLPKWPALMDGGGSIAFNNESMLINEQGGNIAGNPITVAKASIPNLLHSRLTMDGQLNTNLTNAVTFLKRSPLYIGKEIKHIRFKGPIAFSMHLMVPLAQVNPAVQAKGRIQLNNDSIDIRRWNTQLQKINGLLQFDNALLLAKHLSASMLGNPLVLHIATRVKPGKKSTYLLEASGPLNANNLMSHYHIPISRYVSGSATFSALLKLHDGRANLPTSFNILSSLRGISIKNIPAPYKKNKDQIHYLHIDMDIWQEKPLQVLAKYGKMISAALQFHKTNTAYKLYSGEVSIKKLRVLGIHLKAAYIKFFPKLKDWFLNIQNKHVAGILTIPKHKGQPWIGRFEHLYIPEQKAQIKQHFYPEQIPSLDMQIKHFVYGKKDLGDVDLVTSRVSNGLVVDKFSAKSQLMNLSLTGAWQDNKKHQQLTTVQGSLHSSNIGKLLSDWESTHLLGSGVAAANFSLHWPGSPHDFDVANTDGVIKLNFVNGRILSLGKNAQSELGLGRLLNIFSLQTLPQRLTLNFSDLSKKGFKFNVLKGAFTLADGSATTNNAYLNGPVAKVYVNGRVGFAKKDYHLKLYIEPHLTSSLPLIAGVLGGPVAGVVAWAANEVIGKGISQAAGFAYQVTGPWSKPLVKKITPGINVVAQVKRGKTT